jgi:L-fuconolactonase
VIVDAHHHVWDLEAHDYGWLDDPSYRPLRRSFSIDELTPELSAASVDRTVLVEAGSGEYAETDDFLALAAGSPRVAGVVGVVDLSDPSLEDVLDRWAAHPAGHLLVGLRQQLQAVTDEAFFDRADVRGNLGMLADRGLAYDLIVRPDQLRASARLARAVPHLRFVLDHLGKPDIAGGAPALGPWREALAALAHLPNVFGKLSGLATQANLTEWTPSDLRPFVETAVELFGPDRLMFGSDWPVCLLAADYATVMAALDAALPPLSSDERAAVFGGTADAAYQLPPPSPSPSPGR